jgi:beta-lactam-binding protein with PASTA domain
MDPEGPPQGAARVDLSEERTVGDEEWPVDDHYFVDPDAPPVQAELERVRDDETGEVAPAAVAGGRPRSASIGVALFVLALLLAAAAGAWVALRPAHSGTSSSASPPPSSSGTGGSAGTSSSTSTTPTTSTTTTPAPGSRAVPDVTASALAEAKSWLSQAGLRVRVRSESSDAPRGQVVRQSPGAGTKLRQGSLVALVVSRGPARVRVPSLVGLRADSAATRTRDLGLVPELRLVRSAKPAGTVLAQDPSPGARVTHGSSVLLRIAKNVPPQPALTRVRVPDLSGLSVSSARRRLGELGLHAGAARVNADRPQGTVVGQTPAAGAEARKGATVQLKVSSGPALVTVPSVVGADAQSAQAELQAAGFQVRVVNESTTYPAQDGMVASQDPQGGTKATDGATVTITVDRLGQP